MLNTQHWWQKKLNRWCCIFWRKFQDNQREFKRVDLSTLKLKILLVGREPWDIANQFPVERPEEG